MAARGNYTVRVEGLREVTRALRRVDDHRYAAITKGLMEAAGPVASDANRRLDRYQSIGPVTSRAGVGGVFIRQSKRKVTGKRADFGALQMRRGLIPAAEEGEALFAERVDSALGLLIREEGF